MNQNYKFLYTKDFIRDFKKLSKKYNTFPESFDFFLKSFRKLLTPDKKTEALCKTTYEAQFIREKNAGCKNVVSTHYNLRKFKDFNCEEIHADRQIRIMFIDYNKHVVFMECYQRTNQNDYSKDIICKNLQSIKNKTCREKFILQDFEKEPNSRFLMTINWEEQQNKIENEGVKSP